MGLTVHDFHDITMGMAVNMLAARSDMLARRAGIEVNDPEEQYRNLKSSEAEIDELYKRGEIPEDRYRKYKNALAQWEEN
jgi:uncharacterized membrane protein